MDGRDEATVRVIQSTMQATQKTFPSLLFPFYLLFVLVVCCLSSCVFVSGIGFERLSALFSSFVSAPIQPTRPPAHTHTDTDTDPVDRFETRRRQFVVKYRQPTWPVLPCRTDTRTHRHTADDCVPSCCGRTVGLTTTSSLVCVVFLCVCSVSPISSLWYVVTSLPIIFTVNRLKLL